MRSKIYWTFGCGLAASCHIKHAASRPSEVLPRLIKQTVASEYMLGNS